MPPELGSSALRMESPSMANLPDARVEDARNPAAGSRRRAAKDGRCSFPVKPGIGKSLLTVALSKYIETEPHTRLRYCCSPLHQDTTLYPFIAQLERAAGFARDDT